MADLVTDISIVASWNPRVEESPAEVFVYTKVSLCSTCFLATNFLLPLHYVSVLEPWFMK